MIEQQLARLIRKGKTMGLQTQTSSLLESILDERISGAVEANTLMTSPDRTNTHIDAMVGSDQNKRQTAQKSARSKSKIILDPISPEPQIRLRSIEHIELEIRSLVSADATWAEIRPHATQLINASNTPANGARILELAFLRGSSDDVQVTLMQLNTSVNDYYPCIHQAVRAHIVARLWKDGNANEIAAPIFKVRNEDFLQPIERLFAFYSMSQADDPTGPFMYFRKYRRELIGALDTVGPHVGVEAGHFYITVAKLAVALGYDEEARSVLEAISADNRFFDEALKISLEARVENQKIGCSKYKDTLLATSDYRKRLEILAGFFVATRDLGGFRDRNRPAFNELLRQPFDYFNDDPEIVSSLSHLLVKNRDLESMLPNLFEVFRINALRFSQPDLDSALWSGPISLEGGNPRDAYWHGVGLLHQFINSNSHEKSLWNARQFVETAKLNWKDPIPFSWKELHKSAVVNITKTIYVSESNRQLKARQLRVAGPHENVTINDIESYLKSGVDRPIPVLKRLEQIAGERKAFTLETELLLARTRATHLTNDDISRVWELANAKSCGDLAWRSATVLCARQSLKPAVRHSWDISGEKRGSYSMIPIERPVADLCMKGFSRAGMRLCYAILQVGPLLPELLSYLDPTSKLHKRPAAVSGSGEAEVDKLLYGLNWLKHSRKSYHFGFQGRDPGIPGFIQVLPSNNWSILVAKLSECLGVNSWGWSLSRLNSNIVDLIPRLATRQDLKRHSNKIAKWLRALKPEQRAAWQELAQLSRVISDTEAKEIMAVFVCQLATVIHQNHHLALTSLQSMRAPVGVIWNFENWLLSDSYTKIRKTIGTNTRVLVPNSLQRINSIVD
jgi:hypothetical protein